MASKNLRRLKRLEVLAVARQSEQEPDDPIEAMLDKVLAIRLAAYGEPHPTRRRGLLDFAAGWERQAIAERYGTPPAG